MKTYPENKWQAADAWLSQLAGRPVSAKVLTVLGLEMLAFALVITLVEHPLLGLWLIWKIWTFCAAWLRPELAKLPLEEEL